MRPMGVAVMETGDPRWLVEVYRRIAMKEGTFSDLGLGTYLLYEKWGHGRRCQKRGGRELL